jgi:hypothetical protein
MNVGRWRFDRGPGAMVITEFFKPLLTFLYEHWTQIVPIVGSAVVGWWFGKRRARQAWRKREFLDRLNFFLTTLKDGKLLIRTLMEKRCDEVFLNTVASEAVVASARQTTESDPLLPLPEADYWFYLNAVLNELAEKFAEGSLRRDLGQPVTCGRYLICLTSEAAGTARTRKVRSLVVQKSLLVNLPAAVPLLEAPSHSTRWKTLQQLAALYAATPDRFLEVELCV